MLPPISKRDPTVAAVLRRWRALTGGSRTIDADRPTLVACSGGADSVALALALHSTGRLTGLAHIVHDLRTPHEAAGDRDCVASLAARLGTPFSERAVAVRSFPGSVEAAARSLRYRALGELAREAGCRFVATAHHADDQLETLIMRLARGSGPRGLRGILPRRKLAPSGVIVIRPCLGVGRADLAALCAAAEITPRVDSTNADTTFARNAVRANVVPELMSLFPGLAARADEFASRMRAVDRVMAREVAALIARASLDTPDALSRAVLREAEPAVLHAALRHAVIGNHPGDDRLSWRAGERLAALVRDPNGGSRVVVWGPAQITIEAGRVTIRRRSHP